jgi:hypothetical protein
MDYNSGLASQEYNNYANRAIGMAGQEDARQAQLMSMLAGQQYGAGQAGAGYGSQYGQGMAQSAFGMGSNLSNLATGQGSALAGLEMAGGNNLAQMMYGTGQQKGANLLAGAGATVGLTNNMMQQYNNPVNYAGTGWSGQALASGLNTVGQLGMMYGMSQGGGPPAYTGAYGGQDWADYGNKYYGGS